MSDGDGWFGVLYGGPWDGLRERIDRPWDFVYCRPPAPVEPDRVSVYRRMGGRSRHGHFVYQFTGYDAEREWA